MKQGKTLQELAAESPQSGQVTDCLQLVLAGDDHELRQYGFRYCLAARGWRSLPGIRKYLGDSRSLSDEDLGHVAHVLRRICGENIARAVLTAWQDGIGATGAKNIERLLPLLKGD